MSIEIKKDPYQITWLVRRLFQALSQNSNERLQKFDISVADRVIMEFLYPDKMLTVPEIAQKYTVSRQYVQPIVNSLLSRELAMTRENPHHKRSPHIRLTQKGQELFSLIFKEDKDQLDLLFSDVSNIDAQVTQQTLQSLLDTLKKHEYFQFDGKKRK